MVPWRLVWRTHEAIGSPPRPIPNVTNEPEQGWSRFGAGITLRAMIPDAAIAIEEPAVVVPWEIS
jgi:hypothetical protein